MALRRDGEPVQPVVRHHLVDTSFTFFELDVVDEEVELATAKQSNADAEAGPADRDPAEAGTRQALEGLSAGSASGRDRHGRHRQRDPG